jgi:hypothetical protein
MRKGWQGESKRHSVAAQFGSAASKDKFEFRPTLHSFGVISPTGVSASFGKQIGDSPFILEASDSWDWLTDTHNSILKHEDFSMKVEVKNMLIDDFIKQEYKIVKQNRGFWVEPDPYIWDWADEKNERVTAIVKKMQKDMFFPVVTIDKRADGTVYGADGKHRALAAKRMGFDFIPVAIFTERAEQV